eukprot:g56267.t1
MDHLHKIWSAELSRKAGFPPGVINIVSGDGEVTGRSLVEHTLVNKVSFTGSVRAGKDVQRRCAGHIKRVTLELGGNNAVIVCADADIEKAVKIVHDGLFWNEGEACAAASRIFVEDAIYAEFVQRSVELARQRKCGHPFDPSIQQGAQVSETQLLKLLQYIQSAKQEGARLCIGGERIGSKGCYLQPTVFADVTDNMKIWKEEVFGPIMTINRFSGGPEGLSEVVKRANDSNYGLAAGVFTQNADKGHFLTRSLRAGMVFYNCYHVVDISAPFGGMKESGIGREGGEYGLLPYLEVKMVAQALKN